MISLTMLVWFARLICSSVCQWFVQAITLAMLVWPAHFVQAGPPSYCLHHTCLDVQFLDSSCCTHHARLADCRDSGEEPEIVKLLLKHGADPKRTDKTNHTASKLASKTGRRKSRELLDAYTS